MDDPQGVLAEADHLIRDLLARCGYPMEEFERRVGHTALDHPTVVTTYLAAQAITSRRARREADTEVLRKAVLYYRMLFDELLPRPVAELRTSQLSSLGMCT